jgi:hypothetical protein
MRNVAVLPPIKNELHAALLNLTVFKNFSTEDLIAMARTFPGGAKVHIPDRLTAIVLLLGTAPVHLIGVKSRVFQQQD